MKVKPVFSINPLTIALPFQIIFDKAEFDGKKHYLLAFRFLAFTLALTWE